MITRLSGHLETIENHAATVRLAGGVLAMEVLLPAYVARQLATSVGQQVSFHTLCYLEGQGQGSSFEPRLIGFLTPKDRQFFELFTTVKGIGNRKALRALDEQPSVIAAAIAKRDAKALTALPEIGKRLAETMVAELIGKVEPFLAGPVGDAVPTSAIEARPGWGLPAASRLPPHVEDAVAAMCALGETRAEAERKVQLAMERLGPKGATGDADAILAAVYAGR